MDEDQKKKILIIDDEKKFAEMVKKNLEKEGPYEVTIENEGSKGLETAVALRPHLILMDVLMPDKRGPEVALQIRNHEKLGKTPIVFLTATVQKGQTQAFGGIVDGAPFQMKPTLSKPVKTKDLIDLIEQSLNPKE